MTKPIAPRLVRRLTVTLLPAVSTFAAWWLFLGMDGDDQYDAAQCVGAALVLIAIGAGAGWLARADERPAVILSAGAGISLACFSGWMDDETGLFVVGWLMLTPCAFLGAALVVRASARVRELRRAPGPGR